MGKYDKYRQQAQESNFKYADIVNKYKNPAPKSMADVFIGAGEQIAGFGQGLVLGTARLPGNVAGAIGQFTGGIAEKMGGGKNVVSESLRQTGREIKGRLNAPADYIANINKDLTGTFGESAGEFTSGLMTTSALTPKIPLKPGLIKSGVEGVTQGAVYGATQGEIKPSDILLGGALGVAGQAISKGKGVAEKLKTGAEKNVLQALGPTKEKYKQMAEKIAPEFLKKGLTGNREQLTQKALASMDELGGKIDDMFASGSIKGKVKTAPILKSLDALKSKVGKIDIDPARSQVIDGIKDVIKQFGDDLTPNKARALRQAMDKIVYSTKGVIADEALSVKNLARKNAADEIRKQFSAISPDLAKLNKEFNFWSSLDDILEETARRTGPQQGGLVSKIAGSGALAGGVATGGGFMPAIAGAVLTKQFVSAMQSPLWRTVSAKLKNNLADAIVSGNKNTIISTVNEIQKRIPKIPFAIEIKNKLGLKQ